MRRDRPHRGRCFIKHRIRKTPNHIVIGGFRISAWSAKLTLPWPYSAQQMVIGKPSLKSETRKSPDSVSYRGFWIRAWRWPTLTWGNPTLPSAILRFTSEFGMDSGGSTALLSSSKLGCVGLSYMFCNRFANRVGYMSSYSEFEILKRSCRRLVCFINLSVSVLAATHQVWVLYGQASRAISIS